MPCIFGTACSKPNSSVTSLKSCPLNVVCFNNKTICISSTEKVSVAIDSGIAVNGPTGTSSTSTYYNGITRNNKRTVGEFDCTPEFSPAITLVYEKPFYIFCTVFEDK